MASADKIIKKAEKLCESGDYTDALYKIQDALVEDSGNKKLLWKLADIYYLMHDDYNSVKTVERILSKDKKEIRNAIKFLEQFPKSKYSKKLISELYLAENDVKNALFWGKRLSLDELTEIIDSYEKKIDALSKVSSKEELMQTKSELFYNLFLFRYAAELFDEAFEIIDDFIELGITISFSNLERLLTEFERVEEFNPYSYYYLGKLFLKTDKIKEAFEHFYKGININSSLSVHIISLLTPYYDENNVDFLKMFAILYYNSEDYKKSVEFLNKLSSLTDDEEIMQFVNEIYNDLYLKVGAKTYILLAMARLELNRKNYDVAISKFVQIRNYDDEKIPELGEKLLEIADEKESIIKILAEYYFYINDYKNALFYYKKLFEESDGFAPYIMERIKNIPEEERGEYHKFLGDLALALDDVKSAFLYYKKMMELYPDKIDEAIEGLQKLVDRSPKSVKLRKLLLDIYVDNAYYREALKTVGEIIFIDLKEYEVLYKKLNEIAEKAPEFIEKIEGLITILIKKGVRDVVAHYNLAYLSYLKNDIDTVVSKLKTVFGGDDTELKEKAQELLSTLIDKNPQNIDLKWISADILLENGMYEQLTETLKSIYIAQPGTAKDILKYIKKSVETGVVDDTLLYFYESIVKERELFDYAETFIETLKTVSPTNPFVFVFSAEINFKKGDIKAVVKNLQKLLKHGDATSIECVKSIIDEVRNIAKPNPGLNYVLGSLYLKIGLYRNAFSAFEEIVGKDSDKDKLIIERINDIISQNQDNVDAFILLGKIHFMNKDYRNAITVFNRAIHIDEKNAEKLFPYFVEMSKESDQFYLLELLKIYTILGKIDEIMEIMDDLEIEEDYFLKFMQVLKAIVDKYPENSDFALRLGMILLDSKKYDEALNYFEKVLKNGDEEQILILEKKIESKKEEDESLFQFYINILHHLSDETKMIGLLERLLEEENEKFLRMTYKKFLDESEKKHSAQFIFQMLKSAIFLDEKDDFFTLLNKNFLLLDENGFLEILFNGALEKYGYISEIISLYLSYLLKSGDIGKIDLLYEKIDFSLFSDDDLIKYALFYAELKKEQGDIETYKKYKRIAHSKKPTYKKLKKIHGEIKKMKNSFLYSYLSEATGDKEKLQLAKLYLDDGEFDKAFAILKNRIDDPKLEKKRFVLLLSYYFLTDKKMSFLTLADKILFDPFKMDEIDVEIAKKMIRFYRDFKMYGKAGYYLHFLKGVIDDDEYEKINAIILKEKNKFENGNTGTFLIK